MDISVRFYNRFKGGNLTLANLPLNLGVDYFNSIEMQGTAKHLSMQTYVKYNTEPEFLKGILTLEFPDEQVSMEHQFWNQLVIVTTTGEDPGEVYMVHRKFCELIATQAKLIAGQIVVKPKLPWISMLLTWIFKKLRIEIAVQPSIN